MVSTWSFVANSKSCFTVEVIGLTMISRVNDHLPHLALTLPGNIPDRNVTLILTLCGFVLVSKYNSGSVLFVIEVKTAKDWIELAEQMWCNAVLTSELQTSLENDASSPHKFSCSSFSFRCRLFLSNKCKTPHFVQHYPRGWLPLPINHFGDSLSLKLTNKRVLQSGYKDKSQKNQTKGSIWGFEA